MKGFKLKDFYESSAVPISIVVGLVGFTYSSILTFLTPYAKEIGLWMLLVSSLLSMQISLLPLDRSRASYLI